MLTTPSELSAKTGSPGPVPREVWLNRHPQTPRRCLADPHQLPTEHPEPSLTPTVTSWCQDKPDRSHVTHFLSSPTCGRHTSSKDRQDLEYSVLPRWEGGLTWSKTAPQFRAPS